MEKFVRIRVYLETRIPDFRFSRMKKYWGGSVEQS